MNQPLPRAVWVFGLVSFFNDFASDMVVPLIPILLAGVLSAGPLALGLIEGTAEAVASFLKLWAGRKTDKIGGRRKAFAVAGYALSNAARPLLALAGHWATVLVLRSVDRVGKGLRSAPRDAMVADAVGMDMRGAAFGVQRAFDNAGAVLGALAAAAVLFWLTDNVALVVALSAVPGFIAVLVFAFGVREPTTIPRETPLPALRWDVLGGPMQRILATLCVFTFARVSDTFIVLYGYQLGLGTIELLLMWAALNLMKACSSFIGGIWSDRIARRHLLVLSWATWAFGFLLLCKSATGPELWLATLYVGVCAGLGEGVERALIRDHSRAGEAGTAYGWYYCLTGFAAIPAGLAFGAIWHWQSAAMAFSFAGAVAALCALSLVVPGQPGPSVPEQVLK